MNSKQLEILLSQFEDKWFFLRYRYYIRDTLRRVSNVADRLVFKPIAMLLPARLKFVTNYLVYSVAAVLTLFFVNVTLPMQLDWLNHQLGWEHTIKPWFFNAYSLAALPLIPGGQWLAGLAEQLWIREFYQPLLTMIMQDYLQIDARIKGLVQQSMTTLKDKFDWARKLLDYRPFAEVLGKELLVRWRLQVLFEITLEHVVQHSPLSAALGVMTDVRMGGPAALANFITQKVSIPVMRIWTHAKAMNRETMWLHM